LQFCGQPDTGTAVRWQTIFATAATAVSIVLQAAMADGGEATGDGGTSELFAHQVCFFHGGSGFDGEIDDLEVRGARLEVCDSRFDEAKCEKPN
jgi:hypothetical protein